MQSGTLTDPVLKKRLWAGRLISALPALFLLLTGLSGWSSRDTCAGW